MLLLCCLIIPSDSSDEVWNDDQDNENFETADSAAELTPSPPQFESDATSDSRTAASLLQWLVAFVLSFQAKYRIPDGAIDKMFKFLFVFFTVMGHYSPFLASVANKFPK